MPPRLQLFLMLCHAIVARDQTALINFVLTENAVLRELAKPYRGNIDDSQRARLARAAKDLGRARLKLLDLTFRPDTMLKWYRRLVAEKYTASHRAGPGRPRTTRVTIEELVLRLTRENPTWGYGHLSDAIRLLG